MLIPRRVEKDCMIILNYVCRCFVGSILYPNSCDFKTSLTVVFVRLEFKFQLKLYIPTLTWLQTKYTDNTINSTVYSDLTIYNTVTGYIDLYTILLLCGLSCWMAVYNCDCLLSTCKQQGKHWFSNYWLELTGQLFEWGC